METPKNPRRKKRLLLGTLMLALLGIFWFIPFVPALKWDSVEVTRWEKRRGEIQVQVGPREPGWTNVDKISKHVLDAFVAAEDGRFYSHIGIDPIEIQKSFMLNLKEGRIVRGASTITQQVVKMAFLSRDKSFLRKAREALGALLLEKLLSKDEILEWYINLAEFGDSIYGVEKAARHYFRIKPELLSLEQAIHLALVLPSPNGWSIGLRRKNLTKFGHERFGQILNIMRSSGMITRVEHRRALSQGNFGSPIAVSNANRGPGQPGRRPEPEQTPEPVTTIDPNQSSDSTVQPPEDTAAEPPTDPEPEPEPEPPQDGEAASAADSTPEPTLDATPSSVIPEASSTEDEEESNHE